MGNGVTSSLLRTPLLPVVTSLCTCVVCAHLQVAIPALLTWVPRPFLSNGVMIYLFFYTSPPTSTAPSDSFTGDSPQSSLDSCGSEQEKLSLLLRSELCP